MNAIIDSARQHATSRTHCYDWAVEAKERWCETKEISHYTKRTNEPRHKKVRTRWKTMYLTAREGAPLFWGRELKITARMRNGAMQYTLSARKESYCNLRREYSTDEEYTRVRSFDVGELRRFFANNVSGDADICFAALQPDF